MKHIGRYDLTNLALSWLTFGASELVVYIWFQENFQEFNIATLNYSLPVFQILEGRALECYDDFFVFSVIILFNKYEKFIIIDGIDFL